MVNDIRKKGITDDYVLNAMATIPRHIFFDEAFEKIAYEDRAFPIGEGQTISQPYTVAYQSQLLEVNKGEKILEIGTGSGYQACVLAEMKARVFTIERQKKLYERTRKFLPEAGYPHIKCFFDDGFEGLPAFAPFRKIIITAATKEIPQLLIDQLAHGGLLVVPTGGKRIQRMLRIRKINDEHIEKELFDWFSFVPLLGGKSW